jgi:hypothetical protein
MASWVNVKLTFAGSSSAREKTVPSGSLLFLLVRANLLPSRQRRWDWVKFVTMGGAVTVIEPAGDTLPYGVAVAPAAMRWVPELLEYVPRAAHGPRPGQASRLRLAS